MSVSKIAKLHVVLRQIADPSYVGNYSDAEVVAIYRKWAKNALDYWTAEYAGPDDEPAIEIGTCQSCGSYLDAMHYKACPYCEGYIG
jgi:hypothetical protein